MKRLFFTAAALSIFSCSETTEVKEELPKPTAITIKGKVPNSRALPTITHVAAIPVTEEYSASYIIKNFTPITVMDDGTFQIEGIEKDIVILLLNQENGTTKVVDLVALQQDGEDLLLLPLEDVEPQDIDLGTLTLTESTAISSLLPQDILESLNSETISEIATLDDVYRNIENHINNSKKSVDGNDKPEQVFYLKPEIGIKNSMKALYTGVSASTVFPNASIDYNLIQFSTLPIEIPVTEIGNNFSVQSPSGEIYSCPELIPQGNVVEEGDELFVRRYSTNTNNANFMFEYLWANYSDANSQNPNHFGNVNFFRVETPNSDWVPEKGNWTYYWKGVPYGTFDVSFAQPFDRQNRFEGYIPVPSIEKSDEGKLTNVNITWYKQSEGNLTAISDLEIAEKLITSLEIEVSTQTFKEGSFHEASEHIGDATMLGSSINKEVYFVDNHLIDENDAVTQTTTLQDGKSYIDALWIMYELGNELKFSFVWNLHISQE